MSWLRSPFFAGSTVLLAGTMFVNVGNYAFNLVTGRVLGPAAYGELAALISLLAFVSLPSATLQSVAAREIAARAHDEGAMHRAIRQVAAIAFATAAVVVVVSVGAAPWLTMKMALGSMAPVVVFGIVGGLVVMTSALQGTLQALNAFSQIAGAITVSPVLRMSALVVLLYMGLRVGAGVGAFLAGDLSVFLLIAVLVRRRTQSLPQERSSPFARFAGGVRLRSLIPYAALTGAMSILLTVDVLIARGALAEQAAGLYAAGAVLGRAVFFAGSAANMVLLPLVARHASRGEPHAHLIWRSVAFALTPGLAIFALYLADPSLVLTVSFGPSYVSVSGDLFIFGGAMALYSVASVGVNYLLALQAWGRLSPVWLIAVLQPIALIALGHSVRSLALTQVAVMLALNVGIWPMVWSVVHRDRRQRGATATSPHGEGAEA